MTDNITYKGRGLMSAIFWFCVVISFMAENQHYFIFGRPDDLHMSSAQEYLIGVVFVGVAFVVLVIQRATEAIIREVRAQ